MTRFGLAVRNLRRNRGRTLLTVVGVAVAILTFITLRTLVWSWTSAAEYAAKDRVVTRHKVTFVMTLPRKYIDDVRGMPGIKAATFANWFGGKDPAHDSEFFATMAVDPDSFFSVYDEMLVDRPSFERWKANRSGAIVGDALAKKLGWTVGKTVTLESGIYPADPDHPWTFTIEGIYTATRRSVDRSSFYFHFAYLNDAIPASRKDEIGWIVSRVHDPSKAAAKGLEIDKAFDDRDTQTLSQDEAAFNASFLAGVSAVLNALDIVSFVILLIMLLVLGNTIAMGVRERTQEYALMRAIGFSPAQLASVIVGESAALGLLGAAVGLAIAYPLVERGLGRFLEENVGQYFAYFRIPGSLIVASLALGAGLGAVGALLPALSAARLRVTDALRRVA